VEFRTRAGGRTHVSVVPNPVSEAAE